MEQYPVVIIGAGLAGIAAATTCKEKNIPYILLEKENRPGGLCRTETVDKFYFDYTGHLLHFKDKKFESLVKNVLENNIEIRKRSAWIYSKNTFTRYPFQMNLYGLPIDVIVECIYEYSKSCFNERKAEFQNFEEWILFHFGKGIADHFLTPYNTKIFKTQLSDLSPEITGRFVPGSNLKAMVRGALLDSCEETGYNAEFYYPANGGIEALITELVKGLNVLSEEKVVNVKLKEHYIKTSTGRIVSYQKLISTQPITELIKSIDCAPDIIRECSEQLQWVSVLNINLGVKGLKCDKHWIYYPEQNFKFHRVGFTHNFSYTMAPDGYGSIYIEISYTKNKIDINEAITTSVNQLLAIGMIDSWSSIKVTNIIDIPFGYALFNRNTTESVQKIESFLNENSIFTAGRFGSWQYFSMEDAYIDGENKCQAAISKIVI